MIILENGHAFGTTLQLKMKIKTHNSILLSKVGCLMFSYDELVNRQKKKKKGRKKEGKKKKRKPWKHAILIRLPVIQPSCWYVYIITISPLIMRKV